MFDAYWHGPGYSSCLERVGTGCLKIFDELKPIVSNAIMLWACAHESELVFLIEKVVVDNADTRPLNMRSYSGLQTSEFYYGEHAVTIYCKPHWFLGEPDFGRVATLKTACSYTQNTEMDQGYLIYKPCSISKNVLQNCNTADVIYSKKSDADYQRMALSRLTGQQAIDPGVFNRLKGLSDSVSNAMDVMDMVRKSEIVDKAILHVKEAITVK